jgi:hypothetical protein
VACEGDADAAAQARAQACAPGVIFHPATGVNADAVGQAQASLRQRILRAFVGRGLLEGFEAQEMLGYRHSGFSVDTSVCIAAHDRAGLERLLRYCARPPFALERLRKAGGERVYRCTKQHSEPGGKLHGKRGTQPARARPASSAQEPSAWTATKAPSKTCTSTCSKATSNKPTRSKPFTASNWR